MTARQVFSMAIIAAASSALTACPTKKTKRSKRDTTVFFGSIVVRDRTPAVDRLTNLTPEGLEKRVMRHLEKHSHIRVSKKKNAAAYRIRIDLGIGRRGRRRTVLVSARARRGGYDDDAIALQASAASSLDKGQPAKAALLAALDGVIEDIAFQAELVIAPSADLVAALKDRRDLERLASAIEIVALRKIPKAVPTLMELLRHKTARISDRAIGALAAIGDRRAVKALAGLAKFTDTARMAKVLDAIGTLGGEEARQYLEFVAVGHEDADIKNLATEALARMKRQGSPSK